MGKVEEPGTGPIKLDAGKKYKIDEFCLEPTSFQVLEEKLTKNGLVTSAVDTKVTTRQTYVLTGMEGDLLQKDGKLTFIRRAGALPLDTIRPSRSPLSRPATIRLSS